MFNNIGKKIKTLAAVISYLGIAICIISSIVILSISTNIDYGIAPFIIIGLILLIVGPFVSWISGFLLYGFGELIDNSQIIKESLKYKPKSHNDKKFEDLVERNIISKESEEKMTSNHNSKNFNYSDFEIPIIVSKPKKSHTKICMDCGREVPLEQKICKCGNELGKSIIQQCPNCEENLEFMEYTEADFQEEQICPFCGIKLTLKS